jgi:hypothetical protein
MLPIHLAASQGRIDVIELLLKRDLDNNVLISLNNDPNQTAFSFAYQAIINDQLNCAQWLVKKGFKLRPGEANAILLKILNDQTNV